MILHRLGERTENDAVLGQFLLVRRAHRHAVEHRVHRYAGQSLALVQRHAQLVIGFQQLGVDFIKALRPILILRAGSRIITNGLIIDRLVLHVRPARFLHLLPMTEGLEAPLGEPLRLVLFPGDLAHHFLVEAGRQRVRLHIGVKTPLVLLVNEAIDSFRVGAHAMNYCLAVQSGHSPRMDISTCFTLKPRGTRKSLAFGLVLLSKSVIRPHSSH